MKINVNFDVDIKDKYVKNLYKKFNVAKFERFNFLLIEIENNIDLFIKFEKDFHLRIYEKIIS